MKVIGEDTVLTNTGPHYGWWMLAAIAFLGNYWDGLLELVDQWGREEFSYAYLVAPLSAWLIWQHRNAIAPLNPTGSWIGLLIVAASLFIALVGQMSTVYTLVFYSMVMTIFGLALAQIGWRGVLVIAAPLGYLLFMVPLPPFLYNSLSLKMQLISSSLGVGMLRTLGVDVFLEGNLIDLGAYQIQVAEACDGLRYLFPLLSFSYLIAYMYRGPLWQKLVIFLSAAPLTILINSARLAIMGLLVRYVAVAAAEGFLHLFEGWLIFLFGLVLLFAEVLLLARFTGRGGSLRLLLRFDLLQPTRQGGQARSAVGAQYRPERLRALPFSTLATIGLLAAMAVGMNILPTRAAVEVAPSRLASFPLWIDGWRGDAMPADPQIDKVARRLGIDDFILADYQQGADQIPVNLYIAYFNSQNNRRAAHSPRSCMPAGGWQITDLQRITVDGILNRAGSITVNRAVIDNSNAQQLVYYWFEQRGRHLVNEYMVKWMIFWDGLTKNRTDGSLVRLMTDVPERGAFDEADARLAAFLRSTYADIVDHVPN